MKRSRTVNMILTGAMSISTGTLLTIAIREPNIYNYILLTILIVASILQISCHAQEIQEEEERKIAMAKSEEMAEAIAEEEAKILVDAKKKDKVETQTDAKKDVMEGK